LQKYKTFDWFFEALYDQLKSNCNRGFQKSNKQSLKFGYFPQGCVTSIKEVEEGDENEEYQGSYEPPSLAAHTA